MNDIICCSKDYKYDSWIHDQDWHKNKYPPTITCSVCGYDTGLPKSGFHMVIEPPGLRCPKCGNIIIRSNNAIWG